MKCGNTLRKLQSSQRQLPTFSRFLIGRSNRSYESPTKKDKSKVMLKVVEIWDALPTFVAETDRGETTKKLKKEHFQTIKRKWQTTSSSKTMGK
ncbi:hypothetical protein K1719_039921 [Acacia pycnantha]|nr:hypothetical protein K1719_039921 [Acacia pycnantha]